MNKLKIGAVVMLSSTFAYLGGQKHAQYTKEEIPVMVVTKDNAAGFRHWVNAGNLIDRKVFPFRIDSVGYTNFINNFHELKDSVLTLPEFLCLFYTVYNETGGKFKSLSEYGTDDYFFEPRRLHWGGYKASYNHIMNNIKAGDYLFSKGLVNEADRQVWNGFTYPKDAPATIRAAARNADFYKFRGQGLIQITGRSNFVRCLKPLLPNMDSISAKQLDSLFANDPHIAYGSVKNYLKAGSKVWANINQPNPKWDAYGHLISGIATYHGFAERCQRYYNAILNEGFDKIFVEDTTNKSLTYNGNTNSRSYAPWRDSVQNVR